MNSSTPGHWIPTAAEVASTHLGRLMAERQCDFESVHAWAFDQPESYWSLLLEQLEIRFETEPRQMLEAPKRWLPGAELNIARSALERTNPSDIALVRGLADGSIERWDRAELRQRVLRVAAALRANGLGPGDAVAIAMPMTAESVVIYLAIVWVGAAVVSIADSFSADEIRTRLEISKAKWVFTQDKILRGSKSIPLYPRLVEAGAHSVVVLPAVAGETVTLRSQDTSYQVFVAGFEGAEPAPSIGSIARVSNILFSSGTTGTPKAIPWTQLTPIKAAADAWAHHDIHPGEVVVGQPTSAG